MAGPGKDEAPSVRRLIRDAVPALGIGVPFCIAAGLASIYFGRPIIAAFILGWKAVLGW